MKLKQELSEHIRACFTGLWIESQEHSDSLTEIAQLCRDEQWQLAAWDIEGGLQSPAGAASDPNDFEAKDPLFAIRSLQTMRTPDGTTVLVLQNFHRFLQSAEIVQALAQQIVAGKVHRTILIVLSPVVQIPVELQKLFVVLTHSLPNRQQLQEIAEGIATEEGEFPTGDERDRILDAAAGLTRLEAENAFSLSLVRHESIQADVVWELKTQALNNGGLLSLYRGADDFQTLGGLSFLKAFCQRAMRHTRNPDPLKRPRGVLLLSPPGCGKSQFCKALGNEVGRPVLQLDVGSLMGSLVGQSEERTRQALSVVDAMAPCVLMIDEVEKAFSGMTGSGDSGVTSRMFGTFLSWLNDHTSDVFVVCTANDVSKLPPEFARSERFDGLFFLDLPDRAEKDGIWEIWQQVYGISASAEDRPCDDQWTGAEIKACCRLAALLETDLSKAALHVVPVATTAVESMDRLRNWASGRCLSASEPGVYRLKQRVPKSRRRVARDPSHN